MGFTSPTFIFVFFPLSIGFFYAIYFFERKNNTLAKLRLKDIFLIFFSLLFYGWTGFKGILGLVVYVVLVYLGGRIISSNSRDEDKKNKSIITIIVIVLISILFYFKYITFVTSAISSITGINVVIQVIWIPLGISFITFSALSYILDVFREDCEAGSLIDVALYLVLFTKIISGPIVLWKDFSPQITNRDISIDSFFRGCNRIMIGFAKKLILADSFGMIVSQISGEIPYGIDMITAWGCAILYTLQIYYDFAGYSDIAIGLSQIFGIRLKENFNFPYTALSITEFWRRWHISLGTWFREYLYIPLGGNRKGKRRTLINLGIVFIITGIWHGAGFVYIFWGCLHGACIIIERCVRDKKFYTETPKPIKWFITMFVVNIGWEAFRTNGFGALLEFYKIMFGIIQFDEVHLEWIYFFGTKAIVLTLIGIVGAVALKWKCFDKIKSMLNHNMRGLVIQEFVLLMLMVASILCMVSSTYSPFIYFQY